MPPRDLVHAPDGRTWYETAIAEAEKRGNLQNEIDGLRAALDPFARHAHCVNEIQQSSLALWCAQALNALSE